MLDIRNVINDIVPPPNEDFCLWAFGPGADVGPLYIEPAQVFSIHHPTHSFLPSGDVYADVEKIYGIYLEYGPK